MEYYQINPGDKIKFRVIEKSPYLDQDQQQESEQLWKVKITQSNLWHNGVNFSCLDLRKDENTINITLGKTDYKTYTYVRSKNLEIPGGYITGLTVFIREGDGYVFLERSTSVGTDIGKLQAIGGALPYAQTCDLAYLKNHALKELEEELYLTVPSENLRLLGLAYDPVTSFLNFALSVDVERPKIKSEEHLKMVRVDAKGLNNFYQINENRFEKYTKIHLYNLHASLNLKVGR